MKLLNIIFVLCFFFVYSNLYATTIHVPGDSLITIQTAINSSVGGDTVLVQPGTYNENISIGKNIVVGSLFLTTGDTNYISSTIIAPTSSGPVIVFGVGRDSTCVLTGFTITGGNSGGFGAGIRCINTSPTISHNIIMNNTVSGASVCWGAGIFMEANSNPKIIFNQILNNTATYPTTQGFGGGIHSRDSSPFIANNIISNNSSDVEGGGIYFLNSQVRLFNNIISGNSSQNGGGIYCDGNSTGIISDNIIFADSASWYGGGIHITGNSNIEISNNVIHSNWSPWVAGLYIAGATSTIYNNTFCYNEAQNSALQYFASADTIYNNIFFGNIGSYVLSIGGIYLEHCDIYGNSGDIFNISPPVGTGVLTTVNLNGDSCDVYYNILMDPLFVDTTNFDFHLTQNSPCIDAGDINLPLDPDNTISDIGAFYYPHGISGTIIQPGYVSGTWIANESPYNIYGEITIHADSTLIIEPGVDIIFQGHYKFNVEGILQAVGTEQDSILFTAANPETGWRGVRFTDAPDGSQLSYCILQYGKATVGTYYLDRRGGAIYSNASRPQISHCTIRNCFADYAGGGIYISGIMTEAFPPITNCTITGNLANYAGGGIYFFAESSLDISDCIINGNIADVMGGGLYLNGGATDTVNITNCTVSDDSSSQNGGGIYVADGHTFIKGCTIDENKAGLTGGGLYIGGYLSMINTTLQGNVSWGGTEEYEIGGGGLIVYGTTVIDSSVITGNISHTGSYPSFGGGILVRQVNSAEITNTKILNNSADVVGGMMINADDVTLVNCEIINNQALLGGTAGIRIQSWNSIINHCTVSGNVASGSGTDALSVNNDAHISNSIFSWNSPYALHISASTTVTYSDFFANDQDITNNAPSGFGLLDTVNANVDSCDVYNNIFLNPLFADTSNGDYSLSWANWPVVDATRSPAIDAGDPTDLKDPDSTTADMGAYYFNYTRPLISASDTLLDFGIVDVGQSLNLPFMIRNTGTASLNIDSLSNSKDVFSHNWSPGSSLIAAGDSLEVMVTFTPADSNLVLDTLLIENDNHPVLIYLSGQGHIVTGIKDMTGLPKKFALYPAYPNPFNPSTSIKFDLPRQSLVTLKVYNILGEDVATLIEKQMNAGRHKYVWNANNLASGIYFYRLHADEFIKVRKIILLR